MKPLFAIARELVQARAACRTVESAAWGLRHADDAYAVQDVALECAGHRIGGWKVGAAGPGAEPHCAPIPAGLLWSDGARIPAALPRVEVEVAVRVAVDVTGPDFPAASEWASCVDAVMPAIEWVDSRLAEGRSAARLAMLADSQSLGALVIGAPQAPTERMLDLRTTRATMWVNDALELDVRGGHPNGDLFALLGWLAAHAAKRGVPLRAGQIVTTGSCLGMAHVQPRDRVRGGIEGLGEVRAAFVPRAG